MPGQAQADQRQEKGGVKGGASKGAGRSRIADERRTGSFLSIESDAEAGRTGFENVQVLKAFMNIDAAFDAQKLAWLAGIHLVFVISALMLSLSDRWGSDHGGGDSTTR
jgi:hypothetical protein